MNLISAVEGELLINGGFEQGFTSCISTSQMAPGWNVWGSSGWHHNDSGATVGTMAIKLWWDDSGLWQDFSVTPEMRYDFSVMCMNWSGDPGTWAGTLWAEFYPADGGEAILKAAVGRFYPTASPVNTWTKIGGVITAPAGAAIGRIVLRLTGYFEGVSGSIQFDNASVERLGFSPPDADYNDDSWVDLEDLAIMAGVWLQSNSEYDLTDNNFIDQGDLEILAEEWLTYQEPPYEYLDLIIDTSQTYQEIDGLGASLTDSSAWLLYKFLNASERQAVLTELFDPEEGIGLSFLRQPMGASDFRLAEYTYDDRPSGQTDYDLQHFSIAYDQNYIIPTLQEILAINPNVKIMASPWSPPAWMKTSGQIGSGSLKNDVYNTYTAYFVKFIQAYTSYGILIHSVTLQNEPGLEPGGYGGCTMSAADQIRLVKLLGPAFENNNITTKIIVWDYNWDQTAYALSVLGDSVANQYIDGSAWHHYAGDVSAQTMVHDVYPDKKIYFTEGSDGTWNDQGFDADLIRNGTFVVDAIRNWAKTVVKWNLALDQNNGPKIAGGCDTCYGVVTINQVTRQISRRPHFYALGHASKFLRPGAVRVASNDSIEGLRVVVFKNTDGSIVSYVVNKKTVARNLRLVQGTQWVIYTIPARSIVTLVWNDAADAEVKSWVTTGDGTNLLAAGRAIRMHN